MPVLYIVYISATEVFEQVDVIIACIFTCSSGGTPQCNKYAGLVVQVTICHSGDVDASQEKRANACFPLQGNTPFYSCAVTIVVEGGVGFDNLERYLKSAKKRAADVLDILCMCLQLINQCST